MGIFLTYIKIQPIPNFASKKIVVGRKVCISIRGCLLPPTELSRRLTTGATAQLPHNKPEIGFHRISLPPDLTNSANRQPIFYLAQDSVRMSRTKSIQLT